MITRHFLKTLIMFTGMIILGLLGVFLVSYFDKGGPARNASQSDAGGEVNTTTVTCQDGEIC